MNNNDSTTKVHENLSLANLPNEIWKDIPDYEGYYQVSNYGRVKSLERKVKRGNHFMIIVSKIKKQYLNVRKYLTITLQKNNSKKTFQIHQLVSFSYLNHKPQQYKKVVDHIDNNSLNNKRTEI